MMTVADIVASAPPTADGITATATRLAKKPLQLTERAALDLTISMMDLTSLQATDTPETVARLAIYGRRPDHTDPQCPPVAAVCVFSDRVSAVADALRGCDVRSASVVGGFPHGRAPLSAKLEEARYAIAAGAQEIDMVLDRAAFLTGDYEKVFDDIAQMRELCAEKTHLKVILETGELENHENVALASWISMHAGADFVKTSTGKSTPAATLDNALVMLTTAAQFATQYHRQVGVKVAGGIKTTSDAMAYLRLVTHATPQWCTPRLFRIGASSLLDDVVAKRRQQ